MSVREFVVPLARRAGVSGIGRPHGLRHIASTEVLDRNGGIRVTQDFVGHSGPQTTMRFGRNRRDLAGSTAKLIAE